MARGERGALDRAALLAAVMVAPGAIAADLQYALRAGVGYSDNVTRTEIDPFSSASAVIGAEIRGARETGRLQYDVTGDLVYSYYTTGDVNDDLAGNLFARSSYDFVPQALRWELDASLAQGREDLLRPLSPGNRDEIVSVSTGPRLAARFGANLEAQLGLRYSIANYSSAQSFDSDTASGEFILGRRPSERSLLGLGISYADVTYDSRPGIPSLDFERSEAFVRWNVEGVRTEFRIDAGYSRADGAGFDDSGALLRLEGTRRLTPFITGFLRLSQQYPTSAEQVSAPVDFAAGTAVEESAALTGSARRLRDGEVGLRLTRPRTTAELSFTQRREIDLVGRFPDREYDFLRLSGSRALTSRSVLSGFVVLTQEDLQAPAVSSEELYLGTQLAWSLGRNLGLDVRIEYRDRDSDVLAGRFSEFSGGVFLRWGRIGSPGAAPGPAVTPATVPSPVSP